MAMSMRWVLAIWIMAVIGMGMSIMTWSRVGELERSTILSGKTHYFDWAIFHSLNFQRVPVGLSHSHRSNNFPKFQDQPRCCGHANHSLHCGNRLHPLHDCDNRCDFHGFHGFHGCDHCHEQGPLHLTRICGLDVFAEIQLIFSTMS